MLSRVSILILGIAITTSNDNIERTPPRTNVNSIGLTHSSRVKGTLDINLRSRVGTPISRNKLRRSLKVDVEALASGVGIADGGALSW